MSGVLPGDLAEMGNAAYAALAGLAPGSLEAQNRQRHVVQQLGLPLEVRTRKMGIAFRLIPAGALSMGSPVTEVGRSAGEVQHPVTLTQAFYCGKFPVTQGQWQRVMGTNPSSFPDTDPNAPVESVSWQDCQAFAKKLCEKEGVPEGTYQLLTEAQWEYACRAGTTSAYCFGDSDALLQVYAWTLGSAEAPQAVGQKRANAFGLYDMHGNVREWCQDWYGAYPADAQTDPCGPVSGLSRVVRGAGWDQGSAYHRSASRLGLATGSRSDSLGLRLARFLASSPPVLDGTVVFEDTFAAPILDATRWAVVNGAAVDDVGLGEPSPPLSLRLNGHPTGGDSITSRPLDLSGYARGTLAYSYQRGGGGDSPEEGDDLIVEYSTGSTWTELDRQLGAGPGMTAYAPTTVSLPIEALRSDFTLRLRSLGSAGGLEDDWFVDDVRLAGVAALPADLEAVADAPYASLAGLAAGSSAAQELQGQAVQQLKLPLEVQTRQTRIVFRLVPAGTFTMGSPPSEAQRGTNEGPQHQVTLTQAFYCGKFEITQGQWRQIMGNNPSYFPLAGLNAPVETVSWDDCQVFVKGLCALEGVAEGTYRLLTEAEWEYACRAGTQTPFCYGNDLDSSMANFDGNYPYGAGQKGVYRQATVAVGSFRPNAWGLYDMHGNVWEWCQDWYEALYPSGPQTDPLGPSSGDYRVSRGGCWSRGAWRCRSAIRLRLPPVSRSSDLGLRLARTVPSYP
ncbi:MAG: formylglycine-generating enzyme family protein [Planctomycetes bacterium]|nr:formylglycine-generating enzyme family protein [Planctomycetota bacterium]